MDFACKCHYLYTPFLTEVLVNGIIGDFFYPIYINWAGQKQDFNETRLLFKTDETRSDLVQVGSGAGKVGCHGPVANFGDSPATPLQSEHHPGNEYQGCVNGRKQRPLPKNEYATLR